MYFVCLKWLEIYLTSLRLQRIMSLLNFLLMPVLSRTKCPRSFCFEEHLTKDCTSLLFPPYLLELLLFQPHLLPWTQLLILSLEVHLQKYKKVSSQSNTSPDTSTVSKNKVVFPVCQNQEVFLVCQNKDQQPATCKTKEVSTACNVSVLSTNCIKHLKDLNLLSRLWHMRLRHPNALAL